MKQTGDYRRWRTAPELAEYAAIASVRAAETLEQAEKLAKGMGTMAPGSPAAIRHQSLLDRAERFRRAAVSHRKDAQKAAHSFQGVFC